MPIQYFSRQTTGAKQKKKKKSSRKGNVMGWEHSSPNKTQPQKTQEIKKDPHYDLPEKK